MVRRSFTGNARASVKYTQPRSSRTNQKSRSLPSVPRSRMRSWAPSACVSRSPTSSAAASWLANGNPALTLYEARVSTDGFSTLNVSSFTPSLSAVFGAGGAGDDLLANTTHWFRVRGVSHAGAYGGLAELGEIATLAQAADGFAFKEVFETSATVTWYELQAAPDYLSCEGYRIEASTAGWLSRRSPRSRSKSSSS